MDPVNIRPKHGPEYGIQSRIVDYLQQRGWLVERMVGGAFQYGIPDLYVYHPNYGPRWLEVKNPVSYTFTRAQKVKFPLWEKFGLGIWILTSEEEYDKLFDKPNWRDYWNPKWEDEMNVDKIISEFDRGEQL